MEKEFNRVVKDVEAERIRQNNKWGEQHHHPIEWLAILMEEVGEASKEIVDWNFGNKSDDGTKFDKTIQDLRIADYRTEMVQVAAVAIQMIEDLDKNPL